MESTPTSQRKFETGSQVTYQGETATIIQYVFGRYQLQLASGQVLDHTVTESELSATAKSAEAEVTPKFELGQDVSYGIETGAVVDKQWDGTSWLYRIMYADAQFSDLIPEANLTAK